MSDDDDDGPDPVAAHDLEEELVAFGTEIAPEVQRHRAVLRDRAMGAVIVERRGILGMTVEEAAAAAGLSPDVWEMLEVGDEDPQSRVGEVAAALGVPPAYIEQMSDEFTNPTEPEIKFGACQVILASSVLRGVVDAIMDDGKIDTRAIMDAASMIEDAARVLTEVLDDTFEGRELDTMFAGQRIELIEQQHLRPSLRIVGPGHHADDGD